MIPSSPAIRRWRSLPSTSRASIAFRKELRPSSGCPAESAALTVVSPKGRDLKESGHLLLGTLNRPRPAAENSFRDFLQRLDVVDAAEDIRAQARMPRLVGRRAEP